MRSISHRLPSRRGQLCPFQSQSAAASYWILTLHNQRKAAIRRRMYQDSSIEPYIYYLYITLFTYPAAALEELLFL
ncbi:hypothetical protein JOC77_000919 [Peribacillus deserti]|uniref:Uncharacterized protein n=1 Tax=Peribacillus deserti TaxID=673318 RepID=A0ABS2QFB1_9BACI|nr:hypothetical protein [Peribacillus deserti]MBM7691514.1 hypothetical protein [Peribacillus deserti]